MPLQLRQGGNACKYTVMLEEYIVRYWYCTQLNTRHNTVGKHLRNTVLNTSTIPFEIQQGYRIPSARRDTVRIRIQYITIILHDTVLRAPVGIRYEYVYNTLL